MKKLAIVSRTMKKNLDQSLNDKSELEENLKRTQQDLKRAEAVHDAMMKFNRRVGITAAVFAVVMIVVGQKANIIK